MSPWISGSAYVAVAVIIVVTDGLWGWHEKLSGDDDAIFTAALWPVMAALFAMVGPLLLLTALHHKLRSERRDSP